MISGGIDLRNVDWEEGERLIFVGGSPRSGTSLVQNILDSHPNIAGGTEFNLSKDFMEFRNRIHDHFNNSEDYSINTLEFCSPNDFDQGIGSLIEKWLLAYGEKKGKNYISEKTPANILFFEELISIFPRSRFIFCLRDPRSVVSSLLEVGKRSKIKGLPAPSITTNIFEAIDTVNMHNNAGIKVMNHPRVLTIRYEDLVLYPENETRRICSWLNIEWCQSLLTPELFQHDIEIGLNKGFSGVWYDRDKLYQKITPKNINTWEEKLTDFSKGILYFSFQDNKELNKLNYTFSRNGISFIGLATAKIYLKFIKISRKIIYLTFNNAYKYIKKNERLKALILRSLRGGE